MIITIYKLVASNLVNPLEIPYIPKGLNAGESDYNNFQRLAYHLGQYVVLFDLFAKIHDYLSEEEAGEVRLMRKVLVEMLVVVSSLTLPTPFVALHSIFLHPS